MMERRITRITPADPITAASIPGLPAIDTTAMRRVADRFDVEMADITAALLSGTIRVDQWRAAASKAVRELHTLLFALGNGKRPDEFTPEDVAALAALIAAQLLYLANWAKQLQALTEAGSVLPSIAAMLARAGQYRNAANATLQIAQTQAMGIPRLPCYPSEKSVCRSACRCRWRIERVGERDWDCTWLVKRDKELCPQCQRRGQVFNPLRIRNGVIEPYETAGLFK